jgi:hypothetical protein
MAGQQATGAIPAMPGDTSGGSKGTASASPLSSAPESTGSNTYSNMFAGDSFSSPPAVSNFNMTSPMSSFIPPSIPIKREAIVPASAPLSTSLTQGGEGNGRDNAPGLGTGTAVGWGGSQNGSNDGSSEGGGGGK